MKYLPPCSDRLTVTYDMLSPSNKQLLKKLNLEYKPYTRYVVTNRVLRLYQSLWVRITKFHRVLQYNQSPWLKLYLDNHMEMRKVDKIGKLLENKRSHANIELVHKKECFVTVCTLYLRKTFISITWHDHMTRIGSDKHQVYTMDPTSALWTVLSPSVIVQG